MEPLKTRNNLPFLLNTLGLTGSGVEVGVQFGGFAEYMLSHWKGKRLYLIDAWRTLPNYVDIANADHNGQLNNIASTFMKIYNFKERAIIIRDLSVEASNLFQDKSLDFVMLDSDHAYNTVKADLKAWSKKIKSGGLLYGHDYLNEECDNDTKLTLFEVKKAVDEWAVLNNIKINTELSIDKTIEAPFWWCIMS